MENISFLLSSVWNMLNIPINIFGYSISLWNVAAFVIAGGVVMWAIGRVLFD